MADFISDLFGGAGNAAGDQQQAAMLGLLTSGQNCESAWNKDPC